MRKALSPASKLFVRDHYAENPIFNDCVNPHCMDQTTALFKQCKINEGHACNDLSVATATLFAFDRQAELEHKRLSDVIIACQLNYDNHIGMISFLNDCHDIITTNTHYRHLMYAITTRLTYISSLVTGLRNA